MRTFTFSRFSVFSGSALAAATLLTACYNPTYSSNADAGMAFRCFASDSPACPAGLVCCIGKVCGDQLPAPDHDPAHQGWCVPPQEPEDMTVTPFDYWNFGVKSTYYPGVMMDPQLTGVDPDTGKWRCHRDDADPSPTDTDIKLAKEPNDLPGSAITLSNPLMADPPATYMGSPYEICPDRSAPNARDIDVFKFRLTNPAKVIAEIKYRVAYGDLDLGLFRIGKDPDTGAEQPQRVLTDQSPLENGCLEANNLMAGTYYIVVRGSNTPDMPSVYSMNKYSLKVYTTSTGASCLKKDMM